MVIKHCLFNLTDITVFHTQDLSFLIKQCYSLIDNLLVFVTVVTAG